MENGKAALFDLDGVLVDTEAQYTGFWTAIGQRFFPDIHDFAQRMKGEALHQIFSTYFGDNELLKAEVGAALQDFERAMRYPLFPGAMEWVAELRAASWRVAVVTSSNGEKMSRLYAAHPGFAGCFDRLFTAADTTRSKPSPEPYLNAARGLGISPERCVVFEDSLNGVRSGHAAGMAVVGISTTLPPGELAPYCRLVVPDCSSLSLPAVEALLGR